jgi:hypothetical protein
MENNQSDIIFEQYFPANISREKQLFLLDLIEKTVELSDTVYPIDGIKNGKLINMHLKKVNDDIIYMSGFYNIGKENRCLEGEIYLYNNKVYIDSLITRLGQIPISEKKMYRSMDKFTLLKTKIKYETICSNKIINNNYFKIKNKVKIK